MPTHDTAVDTDFRLLAIAAARLRSQGLTQKAIAAWLHKSQPEVSRLLAEAEERHYLATAPSFLKENVRPDDLEEVERLYFVRARLREALQKLAPQGLHLDIRVLPDGDEAFAAAAAVCVVELLRRARLIGIMWGRTLERMASRIRSGQVVSVPRGFSNRQCIPLCGDPVHLMNLGHVKYSASHVAAELGQALNPERPSDQPALVGVPAYLPRRLMLQRSNVTADWWDFVHEIPGYRKIFGSRNGSDKPWVDRVDTIISGAGIIVPLQESKARKSQRTQTAAYMETGDFIRERLEQEDDLDDQMLDRLIYGDIGGWLLERSGLRAADRRLVSSLNQGWTGVKAEHLAAVARNAQPDGAPGVILLAAGPAKADMVREIVRRGFVNILLADSSLATALTPKRA